MEDVRRVMEGSPNVGSRASLAFIAVIRRCLADCTQVRLFYEASTRYGNTPWQTLKIANAVETVATFAWMLVRTTRMNVLGVL